MSHWSCMSIIDVAGANLGSTAWKGFALAKYFWGKCRNIQVCHVKIWYLKCRHHLWHCTVDLYDITLPYQHWSDTPVWCSFYRCQKMDPSEHFRNQHQGTKTRNILYISYGNQHPDSLPKKKEFRGWLLTNASSHALASTWHRQMKLYIFFQDETFLQAR